MVQFRYKSLCRGLVTQNQTRNNQSKLKILAIDIIIRRQHLGLHDNEKYLLAQRHRKVGCRLDELLEIFTTNEVRIFFYNSK